MVRIARNGKRAGIDMLLWSMGIPTYERINLCFECIANLQTPEPAEIVEPAKFRAKRMDCGVFAFEERNGLYIVPSVDDDENLKFYQDPRPYLDGYFVQVNDNKVQPNDVATYIPTHIGQAAHFGIYRGDGKILSKWGWRSPILVHDIDFVPSSYCDEILFFRRRQFYDLGDM